MFRTLLFRKQEPVVAVRDSDAQCLPDIGKGMLGGRQGNAGRQARECWEAGKGMLEGRQGNAGRQAASAPSIQAVRLMVVARCGQYEDVLEHAKTSMQDIATLTIKRFCRFNDCCVETDM